MKQLPAGYVLRRMTAADVEQVHDLDVRSFSLPWPKRSFEMEMQNPASQGWVITAPPQGEEAPAVIAMALLWVILDEAHIATFAVDAAYRQQGIGAFLLASILETLKALGVQHVFLEVRRNNTAAQALYARAGFVVIDVRKGYYTDTHEDALVMMLTIPGAQLHLV